MSGLVYTINKTMEFPDHGVQVRPINDTDAERYSDLSTFMPVPPHTPGEFLKNKAIYEMEPVVEAMHREISQSFQLSENGPRYILFLILRPDDFFPEGEPIGYLFVNLMTMASLSGSRHRWRGGEVTMSIETLYACEWAMREDILREVMQWAFEPPESGGQGVGMSQLGFPTPVNDPWMMQFGGTVLRRNWNTDLVTGGDQASGVDFYDWKITEEEYSQRYEELKPRPRP